LSALAAGATDPAVATAGSRSTVALLGVDAALREAVPHDERSFAEHVLVVPHRDLPDGQWSPDAILGDGERPFAALLLRGLVTHDLILAGRCSANLLGPGDLFRPWRSADTSLPCDARWTATGGAAIALLDERFATAARRWPGLSAVVYERMAEQLDAAAVRAAIVALPRVEERILAIFWQLADRRGVVRPDGVVVRLAVTHALIGRLVGARRPTVSLALQALAEDGLLRREAPNAWLLHHDSFAALGPDGPPAAGGPAASAPPAADGAPPQSSGHGPHRRRTSALIPLERS
jgi:CRP/FNR family transcriptional regulator, cyclic AMP receptor protein